APPNAAALSDLLVDGSNDVARRREAEAFVAAGPRQNQRVDPHQPAIHVDQRTATAARIDGGIRLDVNHRRLGLELPRYGADHAERNRILKAHRAAERQHYLP